MIFYAEILTDDKELIHFIVEAASAHAAMAPLAAYCKGRFEASGKGADVQSISRSKSRGVEYRRL